MDITQYAALKFPSLDEVREKLVNIPMDMLQYVDKLQERLYSAWEQGDNFRGVFQDYQVDPLFLYIFGNPEYLGKIKRLTGLPHEIKFLYGLEAQLTNLVKQRIPRKDVRRVIYTPKEFKRLIYAYKPEHFLHKQTVYDKFRVNVGVFGYRQIANELRRFLRLGEIGLSDEDLKEMRKIFLGNKMEADEIKELVYMEFKDNLTRADWEKMYDDPNTSEVAKDWARKRLSYPESPRLVKAYTRVRELEALARKQPLRTDQDWALQFILDGTSEDVKWRRGDLWARAIARHSGQIGELCVVCNEPARYVCNSCNNVYCSSEHYK